MTALNSVELNLLHALQWEIHDFRVSNALERWDLTDQESEAVEKWMLNRIEEIKNKM